MLLVTREDDLVNLAFERADAPPVCVVWAGYVIRYCGDAIALILMDGGKDAFPGSQVHYIVSSRVSHMRQLRKGFESLFERLKADGYTNLISVTRGSDKDAARLNRLFTLQRATRVGAVPGPDGFEVNYMNLAKEAF